MALGPITLQPTLDDPARMVRDMDLDIDALTRDLSALEQNRPDVHAVLVGDPTQGFPPTEDLIETGLFSQLGDGLLYLPQGAQDWMSSHPS